MKNNIEIQRKLKNTALKLKQLLDEIGRFVQVCYL